MGHLNGTVIDIRSSQKLSNKSDNAAIFLNCELCQVVVDFRPLLHIQHKKFSMKCIKNTYRNKSKKLAGDIEN